ncbi:hypothetical protein MNBD_GAMMA10-78 [hydrothermal vent metagenome]|uniref:Uncharacterized protein n=1 Tax=hydrothermal vent metagenome TaxID=652676 RepID=A0A3B0XM34_9ZZZZ
MKIYVFYGNEIEILTEPLLKRCVFISIFEKISLLIGDEWYYEKNKRQEHKSREVDERYIISFSNVIHFPKKFDLLFLI